MVAKCSFTDFTFLDLASDTTRQAVHLGVF